MKLKVLDYCVNLPIENRYKQGIYKIYHTYNKNKVYIGSASGTYKAGGFNNRFSRHLRDLFIKRHHNRRLQNVVNKYGIEGIKFEILEYCNAENCIEREQYWIDKLNPFYNIAKTAGNTLGVRHSIEYLKRVSKPILQYNLDGDFMKEWWGSTLIENQLGFKKALIHQCCTGKNNELQSCGFQWRFKKSENFPLKIPKYYQPQSYRILCYKKSGEFIKEYSSILEADKELHLNTGNISRVLSGEMSFAGNYVFKKYKKNYPLFINPVERTHKNQLKVIVTNLTDNAIKEYKSFRELTNSGVIARSTLTQRVKNNILEFKFKDKYIIKIEKY